MSSTFTAPHVCQNADMFTKKRHKPNLMEFSIDRQSQFCINQLIGLTIRQISQT